MICQQVSGASAALILAHYFQSLRIRERIRFYCLQNFHLYREDTPSTTDKEDTLGESSIVKVLVDATNSITSDLHCSEIILKPGTGLVPRISSCVEYYHVLYGEGICRRGYSSNESTIQEMALKIGSHILVQPWQ